jgi:excisionase family DNA binding protein
LLCDKSYYKDIETLVKRKYLPVTRFYGRLRRMADEEYISTTEAAEQLGITRQRVLQLIEGGRLDAKKFATVYMIRRTSLANVVDRKPGRPSKQTSKKGGK